VSTIDIQFDKKIDNSRVLRPLDSLAGLEYLSLTLLGAMFVFGALFYGWQQYQWIQYGYRIEEAQKRIENLSEIGRQLRLERGVMASPRRIDETARYDLGMVVPQSGQIVTLNADYSVPARRPSEPDRPTQLAQRAGN
jgi:cell division protein FtsL